MVNELVILFLATLFIAGMIYFLNYPKKFGEVDFGKIKIKLEIADNPIKQARGLMFIKNLPENEGMLFVFNNEGYHTSWMINMSIPIDIIWIDKNNEIVHIVRNAQPCLINCTLYRPDEKAKYVVEVNANFTKKYGIEVGDFVEIK